MNILLTSVGRRTYMVKYFKEVLKGIGLVHAANSIETYSMQLADRAVITPLIFDPSYIDFLLKYSIEMDIKAIISFFDIDLPILARNKHIFLENGIQIVVSDYDNIVICRDKWLIYKLLTQNELYTPLTFLSIEKVFAALENKEISYPLIIKPRWGCGSIGVYQADCHEELQIFHKKIQKIIANSYLKYEALMVPNECIIIQEMIEGEEIDLDCLNDLEGNYLHGIPIKVIEMRAGESFNIEIISDNTLTVIGQRISKMIKIIGSWNIDTIKKDDRHYIIDVNCRFNGLSPFSYLAGANIPRAIVNMLLGEKIDLSLLNEKVGTVGIKDILPIKLY